MSQSALPEQVRETLGGAARRLPPTATTSSIRATVSGGWYLSLLRQRLLQRLAWPSGRRVPQFDAWPRYDNADEPGRLLRLAPTCVQGRVAPDGDARRQQRGALQGGSAHRRLRVRHTPAVDRQLQAAHDLEAFVDAQYGGPGEGLVSDCDHSPAGTAGDRGRSRSRPRDRGRHALRLQQALDADHRVYQPAVLGVTHVFPVNSTTMALVACALRRHVRLQQQGGHRRLVGRPARLRRPSGYSSQNDVAGIPIIGDWFNGLISSLLGVTGGVPRRHRGPAAQCTRAHAGGHRPGQRPDRPAHDHGRRPHGHPDVRRGDVDRRIAPHPGICRAAGNRSHGELQPRCP